MGGMEAGDTASQVAVQTVLRLAAGHHHGTADATQRTAEIKRWISAANEDVCSALEHRHAKGGTTIVCAWVSDGELVSAHGGDSRLYLVRDGKVEALTRDHSLAMGRALQGEIALEEVRHHPDRNRVTRSLGERVPLPEYYIDALQASTGRPTMLLGPGDLLVLCSDGLWEPVTEEEIASTAARSSDLNIIARTLIDLALERGAPDNATVVLARVYEAASKK
jgi:protein phosphatase